jgi:uncharacterized protein YdeI (YjbR/CyaY-like superfamily)
VPRNNTDPRVDAYIEGLPGWQQEICSTDGSCSVEIVAVLVNPKSVRTFASEAAFDAWLSKHHDRRTEVWIKIFKKAAGRPSVTPAQAIDVALCWGWIDGIRKAFDEQAFLQRFTPRGPKSRWSQINRNNVQRLVKAGRMTPAGQLHVDAAKADGRWDAAYAGSSSMQVAPDVLAAIQANPKALATFRLLNRVNVYAIAYRLHHIKTPARRAQKVEEIIAMLARGKSFHPTGAVRPTSRPREDTRPQARTTRLRSK